MKTTTINTWAEMQEMLTKEHKSLLPLVTMETIEFQKEKLQMSDKICNNLQICIFEKEIISDDFGNKIAKKGELVASVNQQRFIPVFSLKKHQTLALNSTGLYQKSINDANYMSLITAIEVNGEVFICSKGGEISINN